MLKKNKQMRTIKLIMMVVLCILSAMAIYTKREQLKEEKIRRESIGRNCKLEYDTIFLGDSITFRNDWKYFYPKATVLNSGIDGNRTDEVYERLAADVYFYHPKKLMLLIGINDLNQGIEKETILENVEKIIKDIKKNSSNTKIYLESVYPTNDVDFHKKRRNLKNENIIELNEQYKNIAQKYQVTYVDVYSKLVDENGNLNSIYSKDGLHLSLLGYIAVSEVLNSYIMD